jgi:hypothetical protein
MRALAIVAALAACKGKAPEPKPAPGSGSAKDPWAGADAQPETPATRQARADAALARVKDIEPKLAKLRHLKLEHEIPAEYQSKDAFRAFVHREIEKESAHEADAQSAYVQLGLLPAGIDLAKAEEQAFATQAAAYYDPAQKKFFIVQVPEGDAMLDATSAHELTHGLQDQHFDLKGYMGEGSAGPKLDDDAANARRFVVEGDATFAMFLYALGDSDPPAAVVNMIDSQLSGMGDIDSMVDAMTGGAGSGSGEIAESMKAMKEIPKAILIPMIDSYLKGALVSIEAYRQGGWPAIDALYKDPPESTEQVLHPKEKLLGHRDHPKKVTLPKLPNTTEVTTNVLGELMWQVYFGLWKHTGDEHVSENWGGDRFALEKTKTGGVLVIVATAWDSDADAKRFHDAFRSTLDARLAAAGHAGKIATKLVGSRVFIVDGSDDPAVMAALVSGAKIE